jgi:hypothetical protein
MPTKSQATPLKTKIENATLSVTLIKVPTKKASPQIMPT